MNIWNEVDHADDSTDEQIKRDLLAKEKEIEQFIKEKGWERALNDLKIDMLLHIGMTMKTRQLDIPPWFMDWLTVAKAWQNRQQKNLKG